MVTDLLVTYGHWDLTLPICPPRSYLYSLQPIRIGTPQVESLTGYIARLADAHCVSPGTLIAEEFTSLVKQPNGQSYLHGMSSRTEALNGLGQMALEFVRMLERLTLRDDLRYLSLLLWAEVLPAKGLLRRIRAWCPSCYEDWRTNGQSIYELLLWTLEAITMCPRHQQQLSSKCPHCGRQLTLLAWHSRPGYCAKCHQWLGTTSETASLQTLNTAELEWQIWVARNIGELLAHNPYLSEPPRKEQVSKALAVCIARTTEGNIAEFARQLGRPKNTVWLWHSGTMLPQLPMLLKICYAMKLSLLEFLLNPGTLEAIDRLTITPQTAQPDSQRLNHSFDASQLQQSLEANLTEEPPPSMQVVAQRLGCKERSLRRRFPKLCREISARYLRHREKVRMAKVEESCREVRQIALNLYSEGIDPTRSYIARYLSKPAYFREKSVVATLEAVRKELGLDEQ
jgi:transcriptional regulator with XRE-family HTH domain/ribosomal protein S27AE